MKVLLLLLLVPMAGCAPARADTYNERLLGISPQSMAIGGSITAAATISPTSTVHPTTGTTAIATINLPYTGFTGQIALLPGAAFTTATTGNIKLASTAVVGKALILIYDGSKWWPSY